MASSRRQSTYPDSLRDRLKERINKLLCSKRQKKEDSRVVYVDNKVFPEEEHAEKKNYPDNTIISSKYTLLNFLPKNLFEQCQRIANFYFLCVACTQFVIDTPVTPLTSILPLTFVISVTAIKQGYEDWLRHKADSEVNLRETVVVRDGVEKIGRAMDIKVGDIVKVKDNEEFPCDIIMLSSEDPLGQCFITTANLDGETNLKTFCCLNETRDFMTPESLGTLRARITCMPPDTDLYRFEGVMELESIEESKALGTEHLLLRGARLRNTEYIYGCAVYTGKNTKMSLNSKSKKTKFSSVERRMNSFLLVFITVLVLESVISMGIMFWFEGVHGVPWYVPKKKTDLEFVKAVEHALAFMVLYNYIIPISLYVTVEMQKFLGSLFFGMDDEMFDPTIDERAQANTSDLNEELGQVEYLFTDKTGTLTENIMVFQKCCIGNRKFEVLDDEFFEKIDSESIDYMSVIFFTEEMYEFFKVLVLCHTVRLENEKKTARLSRVADNNLLSEYEYHASSPDEKALVSACYKLGIIYHGCSDNLLTVSFHNKVRQFRLMHVLPFDPVRKRMSVIIMDEIGDYYLLCKGAEVAILDRIIEGDVEEMQLLINEYAMLGLRTLTIAQRKLSHQKYNSYDQLLTNAKRSMVSRNAMLAEVYDKIEQKLHLLGATAVEDKLQDQVPQTIEALRMAGIKVWVLTGDKEETAVNISHAAGHFNSDMHELRLTHVNSQEECEAHLEELLKQTSYEETFHVRLYAFIIDGHSLSFALKFCKKMLVELCSKCVAVLCCRMSPIQKAEVVALVKHLPHRPVTAAIGDGANDVSMIQEADVGIGIMGKEGRQAVINSDYAFGKFKFLRRALLLHGHLYYNRIAILVQYFFYKNVAWISAQVFYAFYSSLSQQSLFDPFYLMFYNLTFTSLPILLYGLFEQHIPNEDLINSPELYRRITRNALLSWPQFIKWNCLGIWHCTVVFFGVLLLQRNGVSLFSSGKMIGNFDMGTIVFYSSVITVNVKLLLETYYWCIPTLIGVLVTLIGNVAMSIFYSNIYFPSSMISHHDLYKTIGQVFTTPITWIALILFIVAALLPDVILRVMRDTFNSKQYGQCRRRRSTMSMLQPKTRRTSSSTVQTGLDNPAMSLSNENLPAVETTSGISAQDLMEKASTSRKRSSDAEIIIESIPGNMLSSIRVASFNIEQVQTNNSENEIMTPQDQISNSLQSCDATVHMYPCDDRPEIEPSDISSSLSSISVFQNFITQAEQNLKQDHETQTRPSPTADAFIDQRNHSSPSPIPENVISTIMTTQPVDVTRHSVYDQSNIANVTLFAPSPSHARPAHHNPAPSLIHHNPFSAISEHKDTDSLILESESSIL